MLLLFLAGFRSCLKKKLYYENIWELLFSFFLRRFGKVFHFSQKFHFVLKNYYTDFQKNDSYGTNRLLFSVPAYFVSLFSFYFTFYGLESLSRRIFGLFADTCEAKCYSTDFYFQPESQILVPIWGHFYRFKIALTFEK